MPHVSVMSFTESFHHKQSQAVGIHNSQPLLLPGMHPLSVSRVATIFFCTCLAWCRSSALCTSSLPVSCMMLFASVILRWRWLKKRAENQITLGQLHEFFCMSQQLLHHVHVHAHLYTFNWNSGTWCLVTSTRVNYSFDESLVVSYSG